MWARRAGCDVGGRCARSALYSDTSAEVDFLRLEVWSTGKEGTSEEQELFRVFGRLTSTRVHLDPYRTNIATSLLIL